MALPKFTMRQLLQAGVHFGHHTPRWNPKMKPFIFGARNKTHIIDLEQTMPLLYTALKELRDIAADGGRILFVGTKRQASDKIRQAAERCGQYFVNNRWLGGMLTNWQTISKSITRMNELERELEKADEIGYTKKEILNMEREHHKLERNLGGIRDMGGQPDALFVIDTNNEDIAVREANRLDIPVIAVVDTNCDPAPIDYVIPGNDDALRAIELYCDLVSKAILDGLQEELTSAGVDVGELDETPEEEALKEEPVEDVVDNIPDDEEAEAEVDGPTSPAEAKEEVKKKVKSG